MNIWQRNWTEEQINATPWYEQNIFYVKCLNILVRRNLKYRKVIIKFFDDAADICLHTMAARECSLLDGTGHPVTAFYHLLWLLHRLGRQALHPERPGKNTGVRRTDRRGSSAAPGPAWTGGEGDCRSASGVEERDTVQSEGGTEYKYQEIRERNLKVCLRWTTTCARWQNFLGIFREESLC